MKVKLTNIDWDTTNDDDEDMPPMIVPELRQSLPWPNGKQKIGGKI